MGPNAALAVAIALTIVVFVVIGLICWGLYTAANTYGDSHPIRGMVRVRLH